MFKRSLSVFFLMLTLSASAGYPQPQQKPGNSVPGSYRISTDEIKLYQMINDYRRKYDLPPIPLSACLCYVASSHVKDLFYNHPDQEPCNSHSWSDRGPWKAFCYPRDENKKNSVWDKPKELTQYKGKGYEIVYWENNPADIDSVIHFWKSIGYFNSFLLNTGKWQGQKWEALGVGIYENYACAWFGEVSDPLGPPLLQGENPVIKDSGAAKLSPPVNPTPLPPDISSTGKETEQKLQQEPAIKTAFRYFIIIRSNVPLKDTTKVIKLYVSKGFTAVRGLEKEGKARISVFESSDRNEAIARLKEIKVQYHDAWLLKISLNL